METPPVNLSPADLRERLSDLMLRDQRRLGRRLDGVRGTRSAEARQAALADIAAEIDRAALRVERRRAAVPRIEYPAALPVSQRKDEILAAVRDHQVVIVAGETGSGKTTQLPKICLELGRGVQGLIGHTQPRRLAARSVADRIAEELHGELGDAVGYKVRFTDKIGENTLVKLMTDGILLTEIQHDRLLSQYDTLIIDEAHERSLNIDFILGYLKQLLPRRPDLKVIITSATIDPERFSRHFGDAPIVEVSGRTYPVEVRYRPLTGGARGRSSSSSAREHRPGAGVPQNTDEEAEEVDKERDQVQAICDAVDELRAEGPGDILVFLSGEREIRDTADALGKLKLPNTEVLPLYARLSTAEQHRVFAAHPGRRIVLATNVAETSLTVPGIKYVIDPGTARISRYSHRLKVQRLPIEPVSQASANQRKGRCGRVSEGICIRLYSEQDFLSRPEFTDPEILRTNLASVILQMTALGLGDIAAFPFVEPPDRRNIADGLALLHELGAIDPTEKDVRKRLTPLGRRLAQLPIDPRLARMVLEAERNGCVHEVMVIAAALSIQDPRERPTDHQQAAAEKHARFADKESDFLSFLNLWQYLQEQQKALSSSQFRRLCRTEFLNYLRVREWQDLYGQLRQVVKGMDITLNDLPADPQRVHVSLLSGLLSHIGLKDAEKQEYQGARNARFAIFPGSVLFRKTPRWVMAAELVETSRLWGRVAAKIEPDWVEKLARHLVKRSYSEPHWEKNQGAVMAMEKVTLYGVPIVAGRRVNFGRIDPELSRELFIRHALVEGDWHTQHKFFEANRELLREVEELELRARRRDILVDDQTLFDFYDQRVGKEVVSARHFDTWWKKVRAEQPDLLTFDRSMLVNEQAGGITAGDYPDYWQQGEVRLPLTYQFEPGRSTDGVTVEVPLQVLNQVSGDGFAWHVPGLRYELVTALLRSLPKPTRRHFVPVTDYARAVLARMSPGEDETVLDALEREIRRLSGVSVPRDAWQLDRVPAHLKATYRVVDETKRVVAEGSDLGELRRRLRSRLQATLSAAASNVERDGLRDWTIGSLPRRVERERAGYVVTAFPALVDKGDSVAVRMFESEDEQRDAMWRGTRRLLTLNVPAPGKYLRGLSNQAKLTLSRNPHGGVAPLLDDCAACAVDRLMADGGGVAWDEAGFAALRERARAGFGPVLVEVVNQVERVLAARQSVDTRLADARFAPADSLADIKGQVAALVYPGFVTATGLSRLADVVRYLRAVERRLEKLPENPRRDQEWTARVAQVWEEYEDLVRQAPPHSPAAEGLRQIRWMIEELRVSYFAQTIGTPHPVSEKRIHKAMDQLPL
ncbi:ATP-dependent RNA helicase HrpA [Streptoalloteichus hindustanus]|uniref:RNA helicase n=1 Tax=Streptoalloteichus hindustanus TaxID=2017 RepID=A0A1M5N6A8_STRHI|nr:ATP-dependent RNA helicase HrpA [Streptoalloteichus hindustanus]SHG84962.1 ATP-dependent helicase HrpA [Streptoalloteichus hindustanus]